ncbi:MAG: hypothetical protein SCALA701_15870 [Candidatus Scalindua sp.]|nr:hypothetical protein [Planctomycetota bacterium]GJQ58786.1 MAG: hypothetical protein SCALA701_15870 [Candidatus Scalindua sp.]
MSEYFKSIKKGAEEALAWKQGQKTGARVRQYTAKVVAKIRKNANKTIK